MWLLRQIAKNIKYSLNKNFEDLRLNATVNSNSNLKFFNWKSIYNGGKKHQFNEQKTVDGCLKAILKITAINSNQKKIRYESKKCLKNFLSSPTLFKTFSKVKFLQKKLFKARNI